MILSEHQRRWSEIKFYYFCLDIYSINKDMIEVILIIEAIAHIGHLNYKLLKSITGKMLGDPYYLPVRDEIIALAYTYNLSVADIVKDFGFTRKTVTNLLRNPNKNILPTPTPLLTINEDQEIYKFCQLIPLIQKAGIHEKERKN